MNFTPKINQKQWNFLEENELLDLWKKNDIYKFGKLKIKKSVCKNL